jgi:RES domain-containing protein
MKFAVDEATAVMEEACQAIAVLAKDEKTNDKRQEAKSRLLSALPYLDHLKYSFPHKAFPFPLFRVRAEKGMDKEESVDLIKTFSYPSPEKCEIARANQKGCPVFYLADNPETALKEAGCEKGEVVYLSQWQITDASKANLFLFFDHPLPAEHPWEKVRISQAAQFEQSLEGVSKDIKEKWQQLHAAYCKAFLGDDYHISSLIGHQLLHANNKPEVQIVVYPSKVEGEQSCNLAIHPEFADKYVQMNKIWKIQITDADFEQKPELLQAGLISGDTINWRKASSQEQAALPV